MDETGVVCLLGAFVLVGFLSRRVGLEYLREGVVGFLQARLPLTKRTYLTGWLARLGACLYMGFGIFAFLSAVVVGYYCLKWSVNIVKRW